MDAAILLTKPGLVLGASAVVAASFIAGIALIRGASDPTQDPDRVAVSLPHTLRVQRHEVTVADWNRCADAGGSDRTRTVLRGQDAARPPLTGINQPEATQYAAWVGEITGHAHRLPTAAEWSAFAQDVATDIQDPVFSQPELDWASAYLLDARKTRVRKPSGSFSVTSEGVADLDGSVWEWINDFQADTAGPISDDRCPAYFASGEHFAVKSYLDRDPVRGGCAVGKPPAHVGLRLVSDQPPSVRR